VLLKLCIYAYLNRVRSGRRLEKEAQRKVELMRLGVERKDSDTELVGRIGNQLVPGAG